MVQGELGKRQANVAAGPIQKELKWNGTTGTLQASGVVGVGFASLVLVATAVISRSAADSPGVAAWITATTGALSLLAACITVGYICRSSFLRVSKHNGALAEESERLRRTIVSSPIALLSTDAEGKIDIASSATCRLFGLDDKEIADGRTPIELVAEEHKARAAKEFSRLLSGPGTHTGRFHLQRKDGTTFWGEVDATSVEDPRGAVQGLVGAITDISRSVDVEEALLRERENFRNSMEASPFAIQVTAMDGSLIYSNRTMLNLWGFGLLGGLKSVPIERRYTSESVVAIRESVRQMNAFGVSPDYEVTAILRDGQTKRLLASPTAITWNGDQCIQVAYQDVTETARMKDALQRSAREWRITFDSISDGIALYDHNCHLVRVNRAFADMFGTTPKEIIGKSCQELIHGTHEVPTDCPLRLAMTLAKPSTIELFEARQKAWIQESASPVMDSEGDVVGAVQIMKNVSDRKEMERRLALNDRLVSIGELVSGVAHELNNPLTGVIGFSHLMMQRDLPDDVKQDLSTISSEAQRAAQIVKNLLAFGQGETPLRQASQVNNILEDVLTLRAYEQKMNNIEVIRCFQADLPEIVADYFQMQQVFLNIVVNAEFFMHQAHRRGTLTITTRRLGDAVEVTVADDGPGIPASTLAKVFDPFFTTKDIGQGTGLGLSMCHGIVSQHGGTIRAASDLGNGATFIVVLPIDHEIGKEFVGAAGSVLHVDKVAAQNNPGNLGRRTEDH